jgi:hypothetical protein
VISPILHDEMMKSDISYVKTVAKFSLEHREKMIEILLNRLLTAVPGASHPRTFESVYLEAMGDPDLCGNPYLLSPKDFS